MGPQPHRAPIPIAAAASAAPAVLHDIGEAAASGAATAARTSPRFATIVWGLVVLGLGGIGAKTWGPPSVSVGGGADSRLDERLRAIEKAQQDLAVAVGRIEGALGIKRPGDGR